MVSWCGLDLLAGLQFDVQEARRRMLYALTTTDPNLQVSYADESRAADERVKQRMAQHIAQLAGRGRARRCQPVPGGLGRNTCSSATR
jgi:hypothetical protein